MKPPMSALRRKSHDSAHYIDDIWLVGRNILAMQQNIFDTNSVLANLGFIVNNNNSVLTPSKRLEHLRFIIDSSLKAVSLIDK